MAGNPMNEIVKHLMDAHEEYMKELNFFAEKLCGPTLSDDSWEVLEKFLDFVKKLEHHLADEEEIVFPELDKLPRKQPLSLAHLEHDDMNRIQEIVTNNIENVLRYKEEDLRRSSAHTTCVLIDFIKKHFALEEEVIFPLIPTLKVEQQKKIVLALEKAEKTSEQ